MLTVPLSLVNRGPLGYLLYVLFPIISFLVYWNHEHILANGSNMSILHVSQATDAVFIESSLMNPTNPILLLVLLVSSVLSAYLLRRSENANGTLRELVAVVASMIILISAGQSRLTDGWRGYNFIEENLYWLVSQEAIGTSDAITRLPRQLIARNQLEGKPILDFPDSTQNVLLIMLEGISGHMIHPSQTDIDKDRTIPDLVQLRQIADQSIYYSQFVNTQRQTNRGQYALLCGDQPALTSTLPKMVQYIQTGGPPCLPQVLADYGYQTIYMQSAPLSYMSKSEFMPRAGFRISLDDKDYSTERTRGTWGVDDKSLFEEARAVIQAQQEPWMLTLLTVGTHHPYTVPGITPGTRVSFKTAAESMDHHLGEFWSFLRTSGTLEKTLVIITSDESVGQASAQQPLLSQAWGFLVASVPRQAPQIVPRLFNQSDLAISVLDYLGLEDRADFKGRSLFRDYESSNMVVFANTYLHQFAFIEENGRVLRCTENLDLCSRQNFSGSIFSQVFEKPSSRPLSGSELSLMHDILSWNSDDGGVKYAPQAIDLTAQISLNDYGLRLLMGGQSLSVQAGDKLNIHLVLHSTGTPDSRVYVRVQLKEATSTDLFYADAFELNGDAELPLDIEYQIIDAAEGVELVIFVGQIAGRMTVSTKGRMTVSK